MIPRHVASLVLFVGAALAVACIDMSAPSGPASISNLILGSPSVVVNDTMRDLAGDPVPLRVIAFDIHSVPIPGDTALIQFFITDSVPDAHITAGGFLIGDKIGSVNVLGQLNQLQTPNVLVPVTFRPDTVNPLPVTPTPLVVPLNSDSTKRGTTTVSVIVLGGTNKDSASQGIIVNFAVDSGPPSANPKFPAAYITNADGKPAPIDTTSPSGVASRQLSVSAVQLVSGALPDGATDTVRVIVSVSYARHPVPGSPVTIRVPIQLEKLAAPTIVPLRRPTTGDILAPQRSQRGNRWARAVVPGIPRPAR